jgi:hypothetical protein
MCLGNLVIVFPPEPPVAISGSCRNGAQGARARRFARRSEPLRTSTVLAFPLSPTGGVAGTRFPLVSLEQMILRGQMSPARGASRHRFLPWRRTRPPFAVSGGFRRHRRLSLDLPASLETRTRGHRKVGLPSPSPQNRKAWQVALLRNWLRMYFGRSPFMRLARPPWPYVARRPVLGDPPLLDTPPISVPPPAWPDCDCPSVFPAHTPGPVPCSSAALALRLR